MIEPTPIFDALLAEQNRDARWTVAFPRRRPDLVSWILAGCCCAAHRRADHQGRMMSELRIYGASDDLIEVEGYTEDEYSNPEGTWHGVITGPIGYEQMGVWLRYTKHGTWAAGVYQLDEDVPLPPWSITIRQGREHESRYSTVLVVDVPDGSTLTEAES